MNTCLSQRFYQCNGIYIHKTAPTTLTPPTEKQFHDLLEFLISPSPDSTTQCPLPIKVTIENKWRWNSYNGMTEHHIFKFRQEIPETRPRASCKVRCSTSWNPPGPSLPPPPKKKRDSKSTVGIPTSYPSCSHDPANKPLVRKLQVRLDKLSRGGYRSRPGIGRKSSNTTLSGKNGARKRTESPVMKKARGRGWPRSSHLRRCTGRCSQRRRWLRFSPTRGSEDGHRISLTLDHVMRELWGGATLKSAHGNELCRSPLMRSTQPPHCLLRKRLGNEACEIDTCLGRY